MKRTLKLSAVSLEKENIIFFRIYLFISEYSTYRCLHIECNAATSRKQLKHLLKHEYRLHAESVLFD